MTLFPRGPWSHIAEYVGTRTTRQTMAHAQKHELREARHARRLQPPGRAPGPNTKPRGRRGRSASVTPALEPLPETELAGPYSQPGSQVSSPASSDSSECVRDSLQALRINKLPIDEAIPEDPSVGDEAAWIETFVESIDLSEQEEYS